MLTLYDNAFSPFARKVRMVLRFKGLRYRSVDALALSEQDRLASVNPRAEVPVLVDGAVIVTDSADIVSYLEDRFPSPAVLPSGAELRAKARRWQRLADSVLDAIIHDISIWVWPTHHIEWLLAHGFQDWLFSELAHDRAVVPCSLSRARPHTR